MCKSMSAFSKNPAKSVSQQSSYLDDLITLDNLIKFIIPHLWCVNPRLPSARILLSQFSKNLPPLSVSSWQFSIADPSLLIGCKSCCLCCVCCWAEFFSPLATALTPNAMKWSEVAQSCLILCNPMDCSLPGSSVHGVFQARVLEWVAISFSRGSSLPILNKSLFNPLQYSGLENSMDRGAWQAQRVTKS